jgi:D-alanyl-D-alanine carboxypeptidase
MRNSPFEKILIFFALFSFFPIAALAQADFNPSFIISDPEMQDYQSLDRDEIQKFLDLKGSYLRGAFFEDASGTKMTAADIIYEAAQNYKINPKYLLVTLQKEQSLVTDDSPTQRQLDWATGYAVCDGCYLSDPKVVRYKGFGKQVDGSAGIIRWYYDNTSHPVVKKKDTPIRIDDLDVTPASWATAFLYTYTPHLHGNANFWRIWNTWFSQVYPNGTLLQASSSSDYWVIDNGFRRHFKSKTALITRADPKLAIKVDEMDLQNYKEGAEISFPNYSLLNDGDTTYLVDYDSLRPFASQGVVRQFGFNPDEIIDVTPADIAGYSFGSTITASTTAPQGVVFKITDAPNTYYLFKDNTLFPIIDPNIIQTNYKNLPVEKHKLKDLASYEVADTPVRFNDGTLLRVKDSTTVYVMENGLKRPLADDDTFIALGYKKSNVLTVSQLVAANIPTGDRIFINNNLTSARNKYLGDSAVPVPDQFGKTISASYLVAEYPSGRIISGKNIDGRRPIASLTKLLTAYEALNTDYKLTGLTIYSGSKYNSEKNSLKLKDGDKVKNKDIFYTMLVASDNSAARFVAANTSAGEDDLVRRINLRLEEWGADMSSVADVTGLGEKNKSTARDLLKILTKVLKNSTIKDALSSPTYSYSEISSKDATRYHSYKNTNQIIANVPLSKRHYRILATKTGYTEEAGGVLAMLIETKKSKKQYVVITMGNPDYPHRFEEPHKIAEWVSTNNITLSAK